MAREHIHQQILKNMDAICSWYSSKTEQLAYPIYSSYDVRDAGYKVSNVDANIYPAGFNNICPTDKESTPPLFDQYFRSHYKKPVRKILLVTEEHTNNPYYWENVFTLKMLIEQTGRQVRLAIPQPLIAPIKMQSATGAELEVGSALEHSSWVLEFAPDLIVSNNDFSQFYENWHPQFALNPPRELGWYQRKKSRYFKMYNQLAEEFCQIAGLDPFILTVETEEFDHFDITLDESRKSLADRVDSMIADLKKKFQSRGIQQEPFVFVKNNAGTYGLAVIRVGSGQEVKDWNYKSRKKMKAAKGGRDVDDLIIQEGIPSVVRSDGASAEPVIYMVGCQLAGGFLRTHAEKSDTDSLNSPGAVYKRLCVSDLAISPEGCPLENVYGWTAKLGLLAIGLEATEMGVRYIDYSNSRCGANP